MMKSFFSLLLILLGSSLVYANQDKVPVEKSREAVSRQIGDAWMLAVGDSSSVVQPIVREGNRYTIGFNSDFAFQPESLTSLVDSVLKAHKVQSSYFLEVLRCDSNVIVYNSQRSGSEGVDSSDVVPCGVREYPSACYKIALTFYGSERPTDSKENDVSNVPFFDPKDPYNWSILIGVALLIFAGYAYFKRKKQLGIAEHIIPIGAYTFDQRNMHLTFKGETVELTSKEADLLFLLHSSKNETVERDTILRIVWGDEGDYVGRTLDVFISKLRKKLAGDPGVKIANIRGVGYRLVVDGPGN